MASAASVQVPATSANLGPGFDCLGLALNLYLRVHCQAGGDGPRITANEREIATDESNLVFQALSRVFAAAGVPLPGLELTIDNGIPLSRGLGSSAAAIAAGLMLGNRLCGEPFDRQRLLEIGLALEGHPDNLAPALFGGLRVSGMASDGGVLTLPVALAQAPGIALFVPDFAMSTAEARRVLPGTVDRADAVFNTGRSSLLVAALASGELGALRLAMEDRLHQPYRASLFPALPALISAALDSGAAGAALSGAGSTVIALCDGHPEPVAEGLSLAAQRLGVVGRALTAEIDVFGALVLGAAR